MKLSELINKSTEKVVKDPIKDKYTVKIGFFKKIHLKYLDLSKKIKDSKSLKEDASALTSVFVSVVSYGLLGSLSMSLFGFGISIFGIFGIGSLLWLIENKFTEIITRILGSIKLVQINN